ncbi:glycosyltransferase family 4 protein [Cyanobium sp. Morenito 9A2]|uniref:glycosyltransferase family 4 protein n=1 Tax=Cyanobium sp. Morenito 9A2 TaxID=2823718 RepID=UPI0020CEE0DA|nr:glycosyltransferase family 4 protein [Cyanobium sp. Morenito 9A2]MCP9850232.1 glycosyltransferase family 4 protein [Cyanobium sp. Morenito 9A2]
MKILHTVESYLPSRHGMSEVVRQISERLVARGHHVTVATRSDPARTSDVIDGVHVRGFNVHGKSAVGMWGDVSGYQRFLLGSDADVIVNFAAQQWATDLALPLLPRLRARKVFVPTGFSALGDPAFASYFSSMGEWMRNYDACIFLSDAYRDIDFARREGVVKLVVIPNGAAEEEFNRSQESSLRKRLGIHEDEALIIHVSGYLSVAKGQAEALQIFSASRLRNATLLLISPDFSNSLPSLFTPRQLIRALYHFLRGRGMRALAFPAQLQIMGCLQQRRNQRANRRVIGRALTREDTVNAFLAADLLLFPSWIECSPLVLFEAAASRTPFLVTDVGNAAEIVRWTGGGRILPGKRMLDREGSVHADVKAGACLLDAMFEDPAMRARMAESAHAAWQAHFTWSRIANHYEQLYESLLRDDGIKDLFCVPHLSQ